MTLEIDPEALHSAKLDTYRLAATADERAVIAEDDGWLYVASGTGIEALSHALPTGRNVDKARIDAPLRWFGERGLGFRLVLRRPMDEALLAEARACGFGIEREEPVMARSLPLADWPLPPGVEVSETRDAASIARYLAVRDDHPINHPPDDEEAIFIRRIVETGKCAYFVATRDGEPIATSMRRSGPGFIGIGNVFVRAAHRGQGVGAGMTAVAAGDDNGKIAWLEASAMGEPVYRRMGFEPAFRYARLALKS